MKRNILVVCSILIILLFCSISGEAYYGMYGGLYGMMGMYGGMMGMYGGMMGMYGGMMGMYGGMMGGLYGGMMGMYGMSSMYSPFSLYHLYYPISTAGGLTYQVPFTTIAPYLGIAGLYQQLFPNLFNPQINTGTTSSTAVIF